jgi:nicotinate phosphoribosyltransferase
VLPVPLLRAGQTVGPLPTVAEGRERVTHALATLTEDGLRLSPGEPALPTLFC